MLPAAACTTSRRLTVCLTGRLDVNVLTRAVNQSETDKGIFFIDNAFSLY